MIADNNMQEELFETPVLYLEEKPPKTNKKLKPTTKRKKSTKKTERKTRKVNKMQFKDEEIPLELIEVKNENILDIKNDEESDEKIANTEQNDPLLTPHIEIKCELNEEKFYNFTTTEHDDEVESYSESDNAMDEDFCADEYEDEDNDDDDYGDDEVVKEEFYKFKRKIKTYNSDNSYEDDKNVDSPEEFEINDQDDDDDVSLKQTADNTTGKKKKRKPRFLNCPKTCKHKCITKFTKQQRLDIFDFYWDLSDEDKKNFVRKHMRKRVLQRIRNATVRNTRCYFLKNYKIGESPIEELTDLNADDGFIKVCRIYFKSTLRISDIELKDYVEGFEIQWERIQVPAKLEIKTKDPNIVKVKKPPNKTPRFLDPETGNLTASLTKKKRRRPGDPQPERFPRPIHCHIRCIFKCHLHFTEEERKKICDIFWTLDFKRRKDFILARIETNDVKTYKTPEFRKTDRPNRSYQTKFYLRSGINGENKRVCKHFMMNTLCINRFFIENAIKYADKITGSYAGQDRRGGHFSHNKISEERRQFIKDHISSYAFWMPNKKSKTKYLHHSLSIKQMYDAYKQICITTQQLYVSPRYYYKVFHEDFRLAFLINEKSKGGGFLLANPNLSHYTGNEPGGLWVDIKDNVLDIRTINPSQSLINFTNNYIKDNTKNSSVLAGNSYESEANSCQTISNISETSFNPLPLIVNPSTTTSLTTNLNATFFEHLRTS